MTRESVSYDSGMADDESSSDEPGVPKPPRQRRANLSKPTASFAVPAELSALAGMAEQVNCSEWLVGFGAPVGAFLFANGPACIVQYNFNTVKSFHEGSLVEFARAVSGEVNYNDILNLTSVGQSCLPSTPNRVCFTRLLACTGRALHGKPAPNCKRKCCGGFGACLDGCGGCGRYDGCGFRVKISATLAQVASRKMCISISGAPHSEPASGY